MSDELKVSLEQLLACDAVTGSDRELAETCLKRLSQPLRLAIFGSHPRFCTAIANFIIGEGMLSTEVERANIRLNHAETESIKAQFGDGTKKSYDIGMIKDVFESNPTRLRLDLGMAVLKKLSILVATDTNAEALCQKAATSLSTSDVILWCGEEYEDILHDTWNEIPERVQSHSYLMLPPETPPSPWEQISDEFADSFRFDPRMALYAKNRKKGVDKETFRSSGGSAVTQMLKREIGLATQAAEDAVAVLEMRYADELEAMPKPKQAVEAPQAETAPKAPAQAAKAPTAQPAQKDAAPLAKEPSEDDAQKGDAEAVDAVSEATPRRVATPTRPVSTSRKPVVKRAGILKLAP